MNEQTQNQQPVVLGKKNHYGWWLLAVLLFGGWLTQIHSVDLFVKYPILAPVYALSRVILSGALWYLLVFWILEMLRLRGGIARPKNEKGRKIFTYVVIGWTVLAVFGQFFFATVFGFTL